MNRWVGEWMGDLTSSSSFFFFSFSLEGTEEGAEDRNHTCRRVIDETLGLLASGKALHHSTVWVGGWVGGWVEEDEAV